VDAVMAVYDGALPVAMTTADIDVNVSCGHAFDGGA